MRLVKFLNEVQIATITDPDEIKDTLLSKCSDFLKYKIPFWKGYYGLHSNTVMLTYQKIPSSRRSKGLDETMYKFVNSWLSKHGFVPRNKAVIVTTKSHIANDFGYPHLIFPVGQFKFTYCMSEDWNLSNNNKFDMSYFNQLYNETFKPSYSQEYRVTNPVENPEKELLATISNKNLQVADQNGYEIWFTSNGSYSLYIDNIEALEEIESAIRTNSLKDF